MDLLHHAFSDIKYSFDHLLPEYVDIVEKAFDFAKAAHMGQYRLSGDPYISHPLAVASILGELNLDHETIVAGILHDVVEDTATGVDQLAELFGQDVATIVEGVTKLKRLHYDRVESYYAENYRKMFLAMANDIRVIFVKLADRLHNMRTCQAMSASGKIRVAKETLNVYAPIANRLGMHHLSLELFELSFAACYPFRYNVLLKRMYRFNSDHVNVLEHLMSQLREQGKAEGITVIDITAREKRLHGIYQKMKQKRIHFSDLMDVYALRVCVSNVRECYHFLGIIHGLYRPKERLFKDYIASPKENGYQSLHTVLYGPYGLSIEIQIRTEEMHLVATQGVAAHWIYKSGTSAINQKKHQEWFKKLVRAQDVCHTDAEYLNIVKQQVFSDEVYVVTPKGKVLELKKGATVLDFAYHIHTDVGNHAAYAKVDNVSSPLNQELRNGQKVHVFTDKNILPREDWLNKVVTSKARASIRHSLKERKVLTERSLGEQALKRFLYRKGILGPLKEDVLLSLIALEGIGSIHELYEKIALESVHLDSIVEQYAQLNAQKVSKVHSHEVSGRDGDGVEIAACCFPIPGDRIVGAWVGEVIDVHRDTCRNIKKSRVSLLPVKWAPSPYKLFDCVLRVVTNQNMNHLGGIILMLLDKKAEIGRMNVEECSGERHYLFEIKVKSLEHLGFILQSIYKSGMVHVVKRELRCGSLSSVQD